MSQVTADFLVELGTEELPPKALQSLSKAFSQHILDSFKAADLSFGSSSAFASPRRLALHVEALALETPTKAIEVWGPPSKIAFDDEGKPSKAAIAFAKKNGVNVEDLSVESDGKAEKLVYRSTQTGVAVSDLLADIVKASLDKLPIPKRMRWGSSRNEFVRPVHWLVLMLDEKIIPATILGLESNNLTRGHRFHCDTELAIANPSAYAALLEESGQVVADFEKRRELIRQQLIAEGQKLNGQTVIDADLLDEVTGLVEWPVALTGSFEERFLAVPAEALISSMGEHQKYFHVIDSQGQLLPNFITISNIASLDPKQVIEGNERVIRPRLSDAAFFFETDKKLPLANRVEKLQNVVFQAKLGTLFEKSQRLQKLAGALAPLLAANTAKAERAAYLCKADLVSDMVLEFDKMQGIAGTYYALHDGEDTEVAEAIQAHYLPKFAGDKLPESATACAVALADRLDTLVGIFSIGQKPTGSKDPFALRRASLAVLRIIIEKGLNLDLRECLTLAAKQLEAQSKLRLDEALIETVLSYMLERLRAWYEEDNISAEVFMAVSAKQLSQPLDINQRVQAVHHFSELAEAQALAAANKRVANLLSKVDASTIGAVDNNLLTLDEERVLAKAIKQQAAIVAPLFAERNYMQALSSLAGLRDAVDNFFDKVMVMDEDLTLRGNRLALLKQLRDLFFEVADISLLVPAK